MHTDNKVIAIDMLAGVPTAFHKPYMARTAPGGCVLLLIPSMSFCVELKSLKKSIGDETLIAL
jgi:hypothetical protein